MRRTFVSSLLLLLFLNFLIKPIWVFGIDLTVQNRVGDAQYGIYSAIFSFTIIFNILLDFGVTHFNNRDIAQNAIKISQNFSRLSSIKLLLGIFYVIILLIVGFFLGYTTKYFSLLIVLITSQFLASFILFLRSSLTGLHLFKTDAVLSILDKSLMILLCALLLFTSILNQEFNIFWFALAQLLSYGIAALIAFVIVLSKTKSFGINFQWKNIISDLKSGLPFALLILLMALYTRVDSIMIEQICGSEENGIYAKAFRLLDVSNQMSYLFGVLLLPIFSRMLAREEAIRPLLKLSFSLVWVGTVILSFSVFFLATPLMEFLYTDNPELSAPVFKILIISSIAFGITFVFGTLLTARGNLRVLNQIAISGFALNFVLNAILIPQQGAVGAATATVFTQFLTAAAQVFFALRETQINFEKIYWLRLFGFLSVAVLVGWLTTFLGWDWFIILLLNVALIAFLSLLFKLFELRAAIELLRQRFRTQPD